MTVSGSTSVILMHLDRPGGLTHRSKAERSSASTANMPVLSVRDLLRKSKSQAKNAVDPQCLNYIPKASV